MLRKPRRLYPGDLVGIVTPASPPLEPEVIDRSAAAVERLGFKPRLAPNARKRHGFLAGSDRERAGDLMRMFTDPKVQAILCVRGGYGTSRLLPLLDYQAIRRTPKIFLGYSDVTALHCALLTKAQLVSFHGPTLNADFIKDDWVEFTHRSLLRVLGQPLAAGSICQGYDKATVTVLRGGTSSGALLGGNLSLLCTTLATPYQPSFKDRILFIEDIDEPPYRFDRMLTQLLNAGLLQQLAGIAVGLNRNCLDPKARKSGEYRQTVEDVLQERLAPLKIPIVCGLPFGHVPHNATLPLGIHATLDAQAGDLILTESAVR